jgi:serine/threonine protein kinase
MPHFADWSIEENSLTESATLPRLDESENKCYEIVICFFPSARDGRAMATANLGAAAPLVNELQKCHLLAPEHLAPIHAFWQNAPQREPSDLADFLVRQGILTRMQAEWALAERTRELVLAQFLLTEEIGSGSMGAVYKARSTKADTCFAIKIVPRRSIVSLNTVVEKVQALREIRHPRVSALVHLGAVGERVYLAWPFLEGGEKLDDMVRRQGRLTPRQTIQIGLQVASGLAPYHEYGLFHGLLKPSDILIGADHRVRLLDFGVGFLLTSERGKSLLDTMTNTRALARGLDCSSPESIMNPLDRTPAGDQYSLGCVLYFCLTGQFPFPHKNPVKKMLGHQCEDPVPLRDLNPQASQRLAAIVQRLMAKLPEERYESIADMVRELQSLTQSGPRRVTAQPTPPSAETERQDEEPPEQRSSGNLWPLILTVFAAGIVGSIMALLLAQR